MRHTLLAIVILLALLPASVAAQGGVPNDPLYGRQWALERIGATCAWAAVPQRDVVVAVIDSGVDLGHPDLAPRLRRDGFDFVDNDGDPSDENGHGTHVSGIVAAVIGNGEGVAGLAPSAQILPVRVMDAEGSGGDRSIAAGITYAVERGARVINLSLGSTLLLATPESSPLISRAIAGALARNVVVVVAAGNDFVPLPNAIVGENEGVIVVAASTRSDTKAAFSNSGPWIDVTAPGERILSTMPTYEVYLTSAALPEDERFAQGYDFMSGTSQAAPFVSGMAALLLAQHPEWGVAEVTEAIKSGTVDIYPNHPSYYQRLRLLGSGRIDACVTFGGTPASGGLLGLIASPGFLAVALGGSGLCLIALTLVGFTVVLVRRRRSAPPAPTPPAQVGSAAPPPVPLPPIGAPAPAPAPALGDTIPAWPAPPRPGGSAAWGRLTIIGGQGGGSTFDLILPETIIGRSSEAAISLANDPTLSRRHARITHRGAQIIIEDLGSSHGTFVNGRRITAPTLLQPGDQISLGQTALRFEQLV